MSAALFRTPEEARGHFGPCALAIGNFDGVHIGHQALLAETCAYAAANNLAPSALTFDPHPAAVVAPERTPELICTLEQRLKLLSIAGVSQILVLPFTPAIAGLSPREFVRQILCDTLRTGAVIVGESFRFGHKQAGTAQTLRTLGDELGFVSQFVSPVSYRGEIVSSSLVRGYVSAGNVSRARRLLGRCFSIAGRIVSGEGVGAKQTVPTLNLPPPPGQIVPRGVFVTETLDHSSGRCWRSITNCGFRPTFHGDKLTIETFLLDPLEGSTPSDVEVRFRRFLRAEKRFPDPAALRAQILRDVERAKAYWRRASHPKEPVASIY